MNKFYIYNIYTYIYNIYIVRRWHFYEMYRFCVWTNIT